jgi:hypothetical protein
MNHLTRCGLAALLCVACLPGAQAQSQEQTTTQSQSEALPPMTATAVRAWAEQLFEQAKRIIATPELWFLL